MTDLTKVAAATAHIDPVPYINAILGSAWFFLTVILIVLYRDELRLLVQAAVSRVQRGDAITIGMVTLGQAVGPLQPPCPGQQLTDDHLALVHRSWRVPERDAEFGGQSMYQIHLIVFGTDEALRRIEYVVYRLESAYPQSVRASSSLDKCFELKALANGYSLIRAEVHVQDQTEPVHLSRFIDLIDKSPPLKGIYQKMVKV